MRYKVNHTTKYRYAEPVPICHNLVHLAPRSMPHQLCEEYRLFITPAPASRGMRTDYFGNLVEYFSIQEAHRTLTVTTNSRVVLSSESTPRFEDSPKWNDVVNQLSNSLVEKAVDVCQFAFDSPCIIRSCALRDYALASFGTGRTILSAAAELTERIHRDFRYDTKATTVYTKLEEVFECRAGVCQDFAHVHIGCLRSIGIPARYVSGYLRTEPPPGQPRLIGADASHAWVSAYCGQELGWVDFDPTNNVLPDVDHVTVAIGRDYGDVCPVQGVCVGGGKHSMTVAVDVIPLGELN